MRSTQERSFISEVGVLLSPVFVTSRSMRVSEMDAGIRQCLCATFVVTIDVDIFREDAYQ